MRTSHRIIISLVLATLMPAAALAEGNIHIGQLKINPYVSLSETFSDNIFYTSTDTKRDAVTTTTPGVRLTLPFRIHQANLEYYSVFTRYDKYTEENTTDYHGNAAVDLHFGKLLGLKLSDQYVKGHEPRGASATGFIEIYKTNTATVSASYRLADLSKLQIDYSPTIWRFETSNFRNRDEGLVSGYVYYNFLPKTSVFLEYDRKNVVYSQKTLELDSTESGILAGLAWEISARSKGMIKGGAVRKDYRHSAKKDFEGLALSADVRHEFTANTAVLLNGQRKVNETSLPGSRYFTTTGAYAELTRKIRRKLAGFVKGSLGEDKYSDVVPPDTTVRVDRSAMTGGGLRYTMKDWLAFGLEYSNRTRHSNITVNNYNEHATMITADVSL